MNKEVKEDRVIEFIPKYGVFKGQIIVNGTTYYNIPYEVTDWVGELLDYIKQLEEKINKYEDPKDMTLMFMWCDEKAKDKIKQLETNRDEIIPLLCDADSFIMKKKYAEANLKIHKVKEILERGKE